MSLKVESVASVDLPWPVDLTLNQPKWIILLKFFLVWIMTVMRSTVIMATRNKII